MLDRPDVIEPEFVRQAALLEGIQVHSGFVLTCERARCREFEEDPEFHVVVSRVCQVLGAAGDRFGPAANHRKRSERVYTLNRPPRRFRLPGRVPYRRGRWYTECA